MKFAQLRSQLACLFWMEKGEFARKIKWLGN